MKYFSFFSGIEAASVAWKDLDFQCVGLCEIDKFPSKVLEKRFPDIRNYGDITKIINDEQFLSTDFDLAVGGPPCQDYSIAGLRKGLDGERGQLSITYIDILKRKLPKWVVLENVPGMLSSNKGADFAAIISDLTGLDIAPQKFAKAGVIEGQFYSIAWRVLDAQYFGVPQRRRRVFVVGYLGKDWRPPYAVLFERESLRGDTKKGRKKGKETTGAAGNGAEEASYFDKQRLGEYGQSGLSSTLAARDYKDATERPNQSHTVRMRGGKEGGGKGPLVQTELSGTLATNNDQTVFTPSSHAQYIEGIGTQRANGGDLGGGNEGLVVQPVSFTQNQAGDVLTGDIMHSLGTNSNATGRNAANVVAPGLFMAGQGAKAGGIGYSEEVSPTLKAGASGTNMTPTLCTSIARRLTPIECERLQGFPDNWTNIPQAKDGPRYKAIGNSMAVPVMRWIGERINMINGILTS